MNVDTSRLDLPVTEAEIPRNVADLLDFDDSEGPQMVGKLAELLKDENVAVRRAAASALRKLSSGYPNPDRPLEDVAAYREDIQVPLRSLR